MPESPEAITPGWLSAALASSVPGAEITSVEVLDRHSGSTGRARLGLKYASDVGGPDSVFVKLPPFNEEQRQLVATSDMGRKEARFYAGPAAEAPLRIPKAYYAAHGEQPTEYIMVLEDLEASGCTFTNRLDTHADEFGEKLIESLARLHIHFWEDPRFKDELSWLGVPFGSAYGAQLVESAREQFQADFPPVFAELATLFYENHERIRELWQEGEQTLIHGDTHAGNQFVDGDRIGIYDWAVVSKYPSVRDIAIYMGNSCPADVRRREGERWVRKYHQMLVDAGVTSDSFDALWNRYRMALLYAFVSSATTAAVGNRWQPIEVGLRGMTNATEACADLETVEAIREAL